MKTFASTVAFLSLALLALPGQAATISVTYDGSTTGSVMPGSANDFIFFNGANYPFNGPVEGNGTSPYVDLTSFTIAGGLQGNDGFSNDATIKTPAGTSLKTGFIAASTPTGAFALVPESNPDFTYNYFNVYLMVSNTSGNLNDLTVSLDGRENGSVDIGGNSVTVSDNLTGTNQALFLEFTVSGLGTALEESGGNADLVVSATANRPVGGTETYIGAVSFIPEPSTYAMMLVGGLGLAFLARNRVRFNA